MTWLEEDILESHRLLPLAGLWKRIKCQAEELRAISIHHLWSRLPNLQWLCVGAGGGGDFFSLSRSQPRFCFLLCGNPLLWRTGRMLEIEAKAETPGHIGNTKRTCMPARGFCFFTVLSHVGGKYLPISISSHETFLKWRPCLCLKHPGPDFKAELPWEFSLQNENVVTDYQKISWNFCYKFPPISSFNKVVRGPSHGQILDLCL